MPSRTVTRSAAGVAAALVTIAMLAGCARPTASSGGPAPHRDLQPAAATASTAAGATDPAAPPAVAGAVISAPLPTLDSDEVALQSAMPGLFGAAELHPTVTGEVISVWSQRSCSGLLGVLRAGQWSIDLVHQPTRKGQRTWAAVLRQGDARALLVLNGGAGGCEGRITRDRAVSVTASGATSVDADGRFLSFVCMAQWDDEDSGSSSGAGSGSAAAELTPSQVFLFGLYTVDDQAFLLVGQLPTAPGTVHLAPGPADGDEDGTQPAFSISLLPAGQNPLDTLTSSLGMMLYPLDLSGDQDGPDLGQALGSYPTYAGGRHAKETVTVTATAPLSGTLTATGLVNQQHPAKATLDFSAPFTCDR